MTLRDVDPNKCRPWARHNRIIELLSDKDEDCLNLINDIKANGQKVPAIARIAPKGSGADYEIVGGARRWWVAKYLGRKLTIELRELPTDEEAFIASNSDNVYSDISEYERAQEYAGALKDIYEGNQSQMAARLNMSDTKLSRFLGLASLDKTVVAAFGDPRKLKVEHSVKLRPAMKTPDGKRAIVEAAHELATKNKDGKMEPASVVRELLGGKRGKRGGKPKVYDAKESGKPMLKIKRTRKAVVMTYIPGSGAKVDEVIRVIREALAE